MFKYYVRNVTFPFNHGPVNLPQGERIHTVLKYYAPTADDNDASQIRALIEIDTAAEDKPLVELR